MLRSDEEAGAVLAGFGHDLVLRLPRGEDFVALLLLSDIVVFPGLYPVHEGPISPGYSRDMLFPDDFCVVSIRGGDQVSRN
jgi:hypothetical protein